jgi:hypothetical protein
MEDNNLPHIPEEWSQDVNNKTSVRSKPSTAASGKRKRKRPAESTSVEALQTVASSPLPSEETESVLRVPAGAVASDETESVLRGLYHQVRKLALRPGCALTEGIYMDCILTHVPYENVLQQMFGGETDTKQPSVPLVTRAYEESYMREAQGVMEKPCIMGSNCEGQFIDEHNPFTCVQFTLPMHSFGENEQLGEPLDQELTCNKMCVLCCRKNTQSLFYDALYNHRAYNACIQLYGNICDSPGEYATEAMLICPLTGPINNMPIPIVAHQRNRYSVFVHNGVRQLRQHRVLYEDFHQPSSSRC